MSSSTSIGFAEGTFELGQCPRQCAVLVAAGDGDQGAGPMRPDASPSRGLSRRGRANAVPTRVETVSSVTMISSSWSGE